MAWKLDVISRFIKPLYDVKTPSFGNLAGRDLFATSSGDGGEVSPTRKQFFSVDVPVRGAVVHFPILCDDKVATCSDGDRKTIA
jgi:hypothetical protein